VGDRIQQLTRALTLGTELAVTPLVFAFVGYTVGRQRGEGWGVVGALGGIFLGLYLGIRSIVGRERP
jgi:hypothetical protein